MTTERIDAILNSVSRRVHELIAAERFYIVLYDQNRKACSFPLVATHGNLLAKNQFPWLTRTLQSEAALPDWVIAAGNSLLIEKEVVAYLEKNQIQYWPGETVPQSWLGVPIKISGQVSGALVVENWQMTDPLDENAERVLSTIARQTATAIENARLYEQLEHKVENLSILNHVGQQLTKGLAKQEKEILELIYKSASELKIDTRNMNIVFYDPDPADTSDQIFGKLRFALAFDEGEPTQISPQFASSGLTGYVIRTKASFNPRNVKAAYQELVPQPREKTPLSWLGVPMIADGQVFGVIVLRHKELEGAYSDDDREMLEILAGQAAVSLHNRRLFETNQHAQEQRASLEKMFVMGSMAAEFAHKMNNIAGTIPIRVNMARAHLAQDDPKDQQVRKQLDKIEIESNNLLQAAQEIRESIALGETRAAEIVAINPLLEIAVARAEASRINLESEVETKCLFEEGLPDLFVDRTALLDTLMNIIKNGIESIHGKGSVTVTSRMGSFEDKPAIEIMIADTGKGIPRSKLPKIFELFYTTKGDKGMGFGLWRDKVFIRKLGGDIDVYSEENHGSTFTVRIPVDQYSQEPNEK